MRGANGCSWYAVPFRVVPALGQVPEYLVEPQAKVPWDVFQEDVLGSYVANDPKDFGPKVTVIVRSFAVSGCGEGLAGVPADEHVERPELGAGEVTYVADAGDVGPVFCEDFLVEGIDFNLASDGVAGPLEA